MRDGYSEAPSADLDGLGVDELRGETDATGLRIGLVVARFNEEITEALLRGAIDTLVEKGATADDLKVVRVPGAWELAPAAGRVVDHRQVDAVIALGCVVRGETPHFEYVSGEATRGLGELARAAPIPIVFGVLTTDDLEQARARSVEGPGNKGREAALAAIEMVHLYRELA